MFHDFQEDNVIFGDHVGSQMNKEEKLHPPSLIVSKPSASKSFLIPPERACMANRSQLLFILKCVLKLTQFSL